MVAVGDLAVARKFYEGVLGLQKLDAGDDDVIVYRSGSSTLNVYRSQYAGTNQATAVTWTVGEEIEEIVRALKAKGVTFEHYDNMPNVIRHGDLHVAGNRKIAWFKDPDGNILNIINR